MVLPLEDSRLGSLTVAALSHFLPRGCIRMVNDSSEYVPAYVCNLLSLTPEASISCPPACDPYLLLQVTMYSPSPILAASNSGLSFGRHSSTSMEDNESIISEAELLLNSLHFVPSFGQAQAPGVRRQQSHPASIGQPPSVQPRRDSSTSSSSPAAWTAPMALSPPLIQAPSPLAFSSAASKSSFCTSAKQFVALFQLEPPLHASTLNIAMEAIRQEWIDKARLFHSFKRCQGPMMGNDEACKKAIALLTSLGAASSDDELVIRFWQKALSQQTQQSGCHTAASASISSRHHTSSTSSTTAPSAPLMTTFRRPSSGMAGDTAVSPAISVPPHQHLNQNHFN